MATEMQLLDFLFRFRCPLLALQKITRRADTRCVGEKTVSEASPSAVGAGVSRGEDGKNVFAL